MYPGTTGSHLYLSPNCWRRSWVTTRATPAVFASHAGVRVGRSEDAGGRALLCEVVPVPARALPAARLRGDGEVRPLVQEVGDAADV
eukprot:3177526-Alexandrium_andersonii.AAC.1